MYVKSISVALQALCIISIGPLADSRRSPTIYLYLNPVCPNATDVPAYWRKRLLITTAYTGSISSLLFFFFPSTPYSAAPVIAALLTMLGNASYATSIVCANAFLPGLAQEDPEVQAAREAVACSGEGETLDDNAAAGIPVDLTETEYPRASMEEARRLLPETLVPALRSISTADLAGQDHLTTHQMDSAAGRYSALLSLTTSRISSLGVALGFFSGVSLLVLLTIPITLMGGTTKAMRVAIGVSAAWWAMFTIPAWLGLPGGGERREAGAGVKPDTSSRRRLGDGWRRVGGMIKLSEIRQLPNLFTFLFAWIFLSDGV
jgi:UMF1 family MFS transporter